MEKDPREENPETIGPQKGNNNACDKEKRDIRGGTTRWARIAGKK